MRPNPFIPAVLAAAAFVSVASAAPAQQVVKPKQPQEIRVMPLGDSITWGLVDTGGYRAPLYAKIESLITKIDWVGSALPFSSPGFMNDWHHEGHPGWKIRDVSAFGGYEATPPSTIEGLLDSFDPAMILLHIGTNDMIGQSVDVDQSLADMNELLGRIFAESPTVQVIVAQIIPPHPLVDQTQTMLYNAGIPAIAESYEQVGYAVEVVDMYTPFFTHADWESLYIDGIHPSQAGYDVMAEQWFQALLAIEPPKNPPIVKLPLIQTNTESTVLGEISAMTQDLIAAGSPTLAAAHHDGYDGSPNKPITALNDGLANGHAPLALDQIDEAWTSTFGLDLTYSPRGYDIEAIRGINFASLSIGAQAFSVEFEFVKSPGEFVSIGSFRYSYSSLPYASQAGGNGLVVIEHEQGLLARGVSAVRFVFGPDPGYNATPAYAEIDVVGEPTVVGPSKPLVPADHRPLQI